MTELMTVEKVSRDENELVKDIVGTKGANLPANVEEVLNVFEFTDFKAKAWKIMSEKLSKLDDQTEAYNSALRSGQQWGIAALYAYSRLGEITRDMPTADRSILASERSDTRKEESLRDAGINRHTYHDAEKIASHPELRDRVIENAQAKGEIPTKTSVLNTIRVESAKARHAVQKKKYEDSVDNGRDRAVADYFEAIKGFKAALDFARIAAERGKFAPEGKNLLVKKNDEIRTMMRQLEELV